MTQNTCVCVECCSLKYGFEILVWPTLMWAKPNLNSLTHNGAWVKREQAGQSNLWLRRNISSFNGNIQTFKGRDTQGDSESDYKLCRKSLINLRKEILFQFVKEIQSRALRERTRGPANCLIGRPAGILIGASSPVPPPAHQHLKMTYV